MAFSKTILLATVALACVTFTTTSANADTYHHVDRLAVKMQSQTRELISEFSLHYRHKSGYSHLRNDAIQLYRVAAHVHSVAHQSGNVHHLRDDLQKADRLFHHMERVLAHTDRSFGGHMHGAAHHVFELMHDIEMNLHHLKRDIESLDDDAHHGLGPDRIVPGYHGYPHHGGRIGRTAFGYNWGNGGVHYDGHRWSIRLGH